MASTAAEAAPEAGSAGQPSANPEPAKRLKRPIKPDKEEHQAAIDQLQNELNKRRTRSETLKQQIEQKKQNTASPEVQELRNRQSALSANFRSEVEKKNAVRDKMNDLNTHRNTLRADIRDQRAKLGAFVTEQKIDERVRGLEYRIHHTSIGLKEETKAHDEIRKTEALRGTARSFEQNQAQLKASDVERERLLEQIKAQDQKIDAVKMQRDQLEAEMAEVRQKDAAKVQDVPAMIREKDECKEVMNALWAKIQQLRADFKVKNNEFWVEQQAFKEQVSQERAERNAQREKEYQARQAERQAAAAEFAGEPYHKEIGLCEQLLSHLGKYTQQAQGQPTGPSTSATAKDSSTAFEGMRAVTKGSKEDDEFGAFMGSAPKKGRSKKGKQPSGSQIQTGQKLNHSLDMIEAFHKLKVSVPTTTEKVPAAVAEVQASKDYWLKKQQEVKETGVLPDEPSSSQANGVAKAPKASKSTAPTSFNLSDVEFPGIPGSSTPEVAEDSPAAVEEAEQVSPGDGVKDEAVAVEDGKPEAVTQPNEDGKQGLSAVESSPVEASSGQGVKVEHTEEPGSSSPVAQAEPANGQKSVHAATQEDTVSPPAVSDGSLKVGLDYSNAGSVKVNFDHF